MSDGRNNSYEEFKSKLETARRTAAILNAQLSELNYYTANYVGYGVTLKYDSDVGDIIVLNDLVEESNGFELIENNWAEQ